MLVLLAAAYFFFMATETMSVDTPPCIPEVVEMHSDVLVDLLVMQAMMFNTVVPCSALEGLPIVAVLVGKSTWAAIGSCRG